MSNSIQAVVKGEVLQSRKVDGKNGKGSKVYHRVLVTDGFGVRETVDIGSNKGERKVGACEIVCAISLDRDQKSGTVRGLRLWEV